MYATTLSLYIYDSYKITQKTGIFLKVWGNQPTSLLVAAAVLTATGGYWWTPAESERFQKHEFLSHLHFSRKSRTNNPSILANMNTTPSPKVYTIPNGYSRTLLYLLHGITSARGPQTKLWSPNSPVMILSWLTFSSSAYMTNIQ